MSWSNGPPKRKTAPEGGPLGAVAGAPRPRGGVSVSPVGPLTGARGVVGCAGGAAPARWPLAGATAPRRSLVIRATPEVFGRAVKAPHVRFGGSPARCQEER